MFGALALFTLAIAVFNANTQQSYVVFSSLIAPTTCLDDVFNDDGVPKQFTDIVPFAAIATLPVVVLDFTAPATNVVPIVVRIFSMA